MTRWLLALLLLMPPLPACSQTVGGMLTRAVGRSLTSGMGCSLGTPTLNCGGMNGGGAAYTGPGDLGVSFFNWYGLRAYSAATRGQPLLNVCNVSDAACVDMSSSASTGALVVTTVGGSSCGTITCTVKTLYDQGPNGATCVGSTCPLTTATIANRPTLTLNCIGALPCLSFASGQLMTDQTGGHAPVSYAQPATFSTVYRRTGGTAAFGAIWTTAGNAGAGFLGNNAVNGLVFWLSNAIPVAVAADNVFHAAQGIFNSTTSTIYLDGASTTVDIGSTAAVPVANMGTGINFPFVGQWTEGGFVISAMTVPQLAAVNGNQHAYWGF